MLFQPIVINHWYFIRHLKRWMICANEISIIYGAIRAHWRERDSTNFFSEPTRKNLIYDLFSSYFMCRRESFLVCRESEKLREMRLKRQAFIVRASRRALWLAKWILYVFTVKRTLRKKGWFRRWMKIRRNIFKCSRN